MLEEYYNIKTKTLTLPCDFNKKLENLPLDTEIIIFEQDYKKEKNSHFDQKVDNLPNTLTHLTFGWGFNQLVDNLPENLTHLTFREDFNQKVDNLPLSLTHLTFGFNFNQNVDNLPSNITH